MSKDERDALPPSYAPASGARRPTGKPAQPAPQGQTPPVRPRRQPGGGAPQHKSIREQGAGAAPLPPSYAPAGRRRPGAGSPSQATPVGGGTRAMPAAASSRPSGSIRPGEPWYPGGPRTPGAGSPGGPGPGGLATPTARRRRRHRPVLVILVLLLAVLIAWPVGLMIWANGKIQHTEALSGAADTPGITYLLAGSDSRADGAVADPTEGQRSDTIMVMHVPESGTPSLTSLPRDTYVEIPGNGMNKLNASYSLGGAPLLVQTVEGLTGLTMDHYIEIGMGGVESVVEGVGGVELCLDYDVADELSGLNWTAGCHEADGPTALAFARMRYSDPTGDIGRSARQRQVVSAVVSKVSDPATLVNPGKQVDLIDAGVGALLVDTDTGIIDLARMALAFRNATGEGGIIGTPPIADLDYRPGGIGAAVLLDEARAPGFFEKMRAGQLTAEDVATP